MKITFIRPHLSTKKAADALEPIVFAALQGCTPPGIETVLYDERIEPVPLDEPTDLVALTVETFTARRAYAIAADYRQRGIPVVMGGFHPTLVPDEVAQHADAIAIGDAEKIWPQIVADVQRGTLQRRYQAAPLASPMNVVFDRRILRGKSYPFLHLVQWGRGCFHDCDFCAVRAFYQGCRAQRPVADVIAEIEGLKGKYVFFVDDNLFVPHPAFEELVEALIPLRIHWASQISLDVARNERWLQLLAHSGCAAVLVGFESLSQSNLHQMCKDWNRAQRDYEAAIQRFYAHGIMVFGTFVFGYDDDTPDAFAQCLAFAERQKLLMAHFNPLTPMPGTPLYQRLQQEGRLLHDPWWLAPDYRYGQAAFRPTQMTPEQLEDGCFRIRRAFNSYRSIIRRMVHPPANLHTWHNLFLYLATNVINRREIYNKQGVPLGQR